MVWFLLALPVPVILSACEGDDDGTNSDPGSSASESNGNGPGSAGDDAADSGRPGSKQAVATIGDRKFEFDMSTVCLSLGGAVGGAGFTDDQAFEINIDIPPEDWETSDDDWPPPSVRITGEDVSWHAGTDVAQAFEQLDGKSQVDSFSVDCARASGTATFIEMSQFQLSLAGGDEPEPVSGTFDVDCG